MKFVFYARPHLLSSPPRRGNSCWPILVLRIIVRQIQSRVFQMDGGCFSLSANGVGGEGRGEVARSTNFFPQVVYAVAAECRSELSIDVQPLHFLLNAQSKEARKLIALRTGFQPVSIFTSQRQERCLSYFFSST